MSSLEIGLCRARRRTNGLGTWLRRAVDVLLLRRARTRQRRQLQSLSDRMLRDIGLTRGDVLAESSKPIWRSSATSATALLGLAGPSNRIDR